jgi:heme iron utilization protein
MDTSESLALRSLLASQPVASLSTLHKGEPAISMVPFAMLPDGRGFVIHVSRLATHTRDMQADPAVGLLGFIVRCARFASPGSPRRRTLGVALGFAAN